MALDLSSGRPAAGWLAAVLRIAVAAAMLGLAMAASGCTIRQPIEVTAPDDETLARLAQPEVRRIPLRFAGVSLRLRPGQGSAGQEVTLFGCIPETGNYASLSRRNLLSRRHVYADIAEDVLQRAGFLTASKAFSHPLSGRSLRQALVVISADIIGLELRLCRDSLASVLFQDGHRGSLKLRIRWNLHAAGSGELLGVRVSEGWALLTVATTTAQNDLLEQSFQDALVGLVEDDGFQDLLIRNASLLALPTPPPAVSAGASDPDSLDMDPLDADPLDPAFPDSDDETGHPHHSGLDSSAMEPD